MLFKSAQDWLLSHKENEFYLNGSCCNNATTISISSGKGGVGKTSIAIKVGKMLAKAGHRVLLIDCDYNLSNTLVKLGVPINSNFYDLVTKGKPLSECLYKDSTFHLLPGCNGNLELFEKGVNFESLIIDIIAEHEQEYDFILLDCPAGISKDMLMLNSYTDHRLVIVNPDKSSITDAYALIKLLNNRFGVDDNFLIANKISSNSQYNKLIDTLCCTVKNFLQANLIPIGGIRKINEAVDLFDHALMEDENSALHKDFIKIVEKLVEKVVDSPKLDQIVNSGRNQVVGFEHDVHSMM